MAEVIPVDLLDRWDTEARELAALVLAAPENELDQTLAGEWSPRQILAHMLDAEIVYATRLRALVIQPGSAVLPYQQDAMASILPYRDTPVEVISEAFLALRAANTALLKALPDSVWEHTIDHPERGTQKLADIVQVFGHHIASHLPELRAAYADRR